MQILVRDQNEGVQDAKKDGKVYVLYYGLLSEELSIHANSDLSRGTTQHGDVSLCTCY